MCWICDLYNKETRESKGSLNPNTDKDNKTIKKE